MEYTWKHGIQSGRKHECGWPKKKSHAAAWPPIVAERDWLLPRYEARDRLWRIPIDWVQVALLIGRDRIGCADVMRSSTLREFATVRFWNPFELFPALLSGRTGRNRPL